MSQAAIPFIQVLILFGFCAQMFLTDCPLLCECKWKSGKESVICLNANLSVVPLHLDASTQILDLTANNLVIIKHDEFSQAGLLNLQKIYISKCRLKTVDRYAFRNLINLVELDLSYNSLNSVPSHAFDSIPELRELKLNGNPIQRITNDAFTHIPQLVRVEISDCKISQIEIKAFYGLERSLEWLKLDKNRLSEVNSASLTILQNLHGLELAANPWNCSCNLRPLRDWMLRKNVPFGIPPLCQHPKRLYAKPWDKLELDEFACVPEIFAYDSKANGIEGKNVTMTCRITGIPEPNVRWMLKNKVIANLSGTPYSNGKKLYVVHLQNDSSDLTILTADVQDAGVYICAAENKAGRVEASVTLAVSRKPPEGPLSSKVLVASVIAGILFVLATCLVSLCLFTMRKRQVDRWRTRTCRNDDDYEKIEMNRKVNNESGGVTNNGRIGDIAVVSAVRKNGDYRVIPGADTDQELDEDDDDNVAAALAAAATKNQQETKFWNPPMPALDGKIDTQWSSEDLHIPRRPKTDNRDDLKKNTNLMCGTFNSYQVASTSSSGRTLPATPSHRERKQSKEITSTPYTSAFSTDLSSLIESDEKKYPDLIENSPNKSNNNFASPTLAKANSEGGGSVSDINELFCTLPRKRNLMHNSRYLSADSQSPLLPESRYGSSGGESSTGSQSSSSRRLSDSQKYQSNLNKNRVNQKSSSYLNLTMTTRQTSASPIHETPLLDIASLENRMSYKQLSPNNTTTTPLTTTNLNTYDYHAAQLERFLEEYRTLQKELTKMKETCDNMRQDKQYLDPQHNSLPVTPSSSEETHMKKHPLHTTPTTIQPNSPNSNNTQNSNHFESDLTRYLLKSSPKQTINNSGLFNS